MATKEEEKITVKIYHGKYSINKEDKDPLYISSLAEYVDKKINEIASTSQIADTNRVGILAALDIADELFRIRDSKKYNNEKTEGEIAELMKLIDNTLSY